MFCTQNQLITEHAPVYPYEAVIRLKLTVSIRLTPVNITAVNSQVWGLNGTGVLPVQPYRTNRNIRLRCAALLCTRLSSSLSLTALTSPVSRIILRATKKITFLLYKKNIPEDSA